MYAPAPFRPDDDEAVLDLIESAPFATLVTVVTKADGGLAVSHLPLTLRRAGATQGGSILRGHMARANDHWRQLDGTRESLAIFHGPHAYVSPGWYADPAAPPTWNYAVVHVYGRPRCLGGDETRGTLDELVARFESTPLRLAEDTRRGLERAIVGFELPVERVEAKFKLGQNRSAGDREGTIRALERGAEVERELAAWTRRLASPDRREGP